MKTDAYHSPLATLLLNQLPEFGGIYDVEQGEFTRVNAPGLQLLGLASEADFLQAHLRTMPLEPTSAARWPAWLRAAEQTGHHAVECDLRLPADRHQRVRIDLTLFRVEGAPFLLVRLTQQGRLQQAERELIAQRQRVERLNAELEQKVADRTHALTKTLQQLEQSRQELAKALVAEQELGELKTRFVTMASHEFRTPLTAVLTATELIERHPEAAQQAKRLKHLHRIRQAVEHLTDILEEFLSVGKIEAGKVEAHPELVDVARLLRQTLDQLQPLLKPGQSIAAQLAEPLFGWVDPSLLRKVVVNLVSNASKYSSPEAIITVQAAAAPGGALRLVVADVGIGISAEDQQHLFERFFRARNASHIPGTGLGLYIVGKYVELLDGTLTLRSTLNAGTTVTVMLPDANHSAD